MGVTFERGPFSTCSACGMNTFGLLRAGGHSLTMRCSNCRFTATEQLPNLEKKVIYLDQFAFSLLFKIESGGRLNPGHERFGKELYERLRHLVLRQQIILPHSDIHRDETTVFHSAAELREAYEFFGGDARLTDSSEVELGQIQDAAKAYLAGEELDLDFSVDEVLEESRNEWLSDMHISVRSDFSMFADGIRRERDTVRADFEALAASWLAEKPSFHEVLKRELDAVLPAKINALTTTERNKQADDPDIVFDAASSPIQRETRLLLRHFSEYGVTAEQIGEAIREFWGSATYKQLPHHRISSYLFAAVARRVIYGQKTIIDRGLMNDIKAIAVYAPYVDAMFIDKTTEQLLREQPLRNELSYKARIYSFSSGDEFLEYLADIERDTPSEVADLAHRIYGQC